jgi:sulfoxide reductase heme-binding subunit YedZ
VNPIEFVTRSTGTWTLVLLLATLSVTPLRKLLEIPWLNIVKRPFITVGFAAWTLMLPLAITSTNAMVRRLGGRNWQRLHYLVYAVALLAITHYWWLVKRDVSTPANYAAVLALLLAYRVGAAIHRRRRRAA